MSLTRWTAIAAAMAVAALMRHLRAIDSRAQTVVMAQVENEVGFVGVGGRDRSAQADRLFAGHVPAQLLRALKQHPRR